MLLNFDYYLVHSKDRETRFFEDMHMIVCILSGSMTLSFFECRNQEIDVFIIFSTLSRYTSVPKVSFLHADEFSGS